MQPQVYSPFVDECRRLGVEPQVHPRVGGNAFAAAEDYIPTALMVFLAKPFFDAFLKKAGEDSYAAFKKALAALLKRARGIKVTVVAFGDKKVDPTYPFSRVVSIYSKAPDGSTLKFLFLAEGDEEYLDSSAAALCDMLRHGTLPVPDSRPAGGIHILYYDRQSKRWAYKNERRKG